MEQEVPELAQGLRAAEGGWVAPPWQGEGGYEGRSCRVAPSEGSWTVSCEGGVPTVSEEEAPPASPPAQELP